MNSKPREPLDLPVFPALLLESCVTLEKSLECSVPVFSFIEGE